MSGANRGNRMSQEDGQFYLGFHGSIIIFSNGVHDHISMKTLQCSFLHQMFCNSHEVLVFFILFPVYLWRYKRRIYYKRFFFEKEMKEVILFIHIYICLSNLNVYPYWHIHIVCQGRTWELIDWVICKA